MKEEKISQKKKRNYKLGSRCLLNKSKSEDNNSNRRTGILAFFVLCVALIIVFRLYFLQVASYASFKALAQGQHSMFKELIPQRGEIFLRDKKEVYPVAVNRATRMAYAVPKEIEDPSRVADFLAGNLGMDRGEMFEKMNRKDDMYEVIKHRLSEEEIAKVRDSGLKGIHLAEETYRYYPARELASNVIGFMGWRDQDFSGRYGIEAFFEKELKGQQGNLFQNKDAGGRWIPTGEKNVAHAKDGNNLVLTIDHIVQFETEKILKSAVEKFKADSGTIVVMEPSTGKILAMSSYPTFDPNEYAKVEDMSAYRNLAVSDAYESGSVFKPFTMSMAVDSGKIEPDTTYVDTGAVSEAGYTIKNSDLKAYGKQTMTQVLENSLNTGVIFAEKLIGNKNFSDYVKRFGFGEPTGIEMFGEASGNISNLKNLKSDIQFFTASFGQGITVTPIQLASAYSVIANGGVLMKPQIVEKIISGEGEEETVEPKEMRRVISQSAALQVTRMLESVVQNGHGKRAGVPGYLVAGKTGTAQVASQETKGYEEGRTIGSFAGFAPSDNPRFTIVVRIDNPKEVQWAESSAAPTFGELLRFLLEYYNVEPTEEFTQKDLDEFNATHNLSSFFLKKEEEGDENNSKDNEDKKEN